MTDFFLPVVIIDGTDIWREDYGAGLAESSVH